MIIEQIRESEMKLKVVRRILESLPDWFAIEEARERYIAESAEQDMYWCV